jgi:tetratricopeptide (TPR) repeat protein
MPSWAEPVSAALAAGSFQQISSDQLKDFAAAFPSKRAQRAAISNADALMAMVALARALDDRGLWKLASSVLISPDDTLPQSALHRGLVPRAEHRTELHLLVLLCELSRVHFYRRRLINEADRALVIAHDRALRAKIPTDQESLRHAVCAHALTYRAAAHRQQLDVTAAARFYLEAHKTIAQAGEETAEESRLLGPRQLRLGHLLYGTAWVARRRRELSHAETLVALSALVVRSDRDPLLHAGFLRAKASILRARAKLPDQLNWAADLAEAARWMYQECGHPSYEARALVDLAHIAYQSGATALAESHLRSAIEKSDGVEPEVQEVAWQVEASTLDARLQLTHYENYEKARTRADDAIEQARVRGLPSRVQIGPLIVRGRSFLAEANYRAAIKEFRTALQASRASETGESEPAVSRHQVAQCHLYICQASVYLHLLPNVAESLKTADLLARHSEDVQTTNLLRRTREIYYGALGGFFVPLERPLSGRDEIARLRSWMVGVAEARVIEREGDLSESRLKALVAKELKLDRGTMAYWWRKFRNLESTSQTAEA